MLKVFLGSNYIFMKDKISMVSEYFNAMYDSSWLSSKMARKIIREVDKSEYIDGEYIQSPVYGGISPRDLSSGCKALLILLNEPDKIVSGDRLGDNCFPLLFEMAKDKDYTITLAHWFDFDRVGSFAMVNARTGDVIDTPLEFMKQYSYEDSIESNP